MNIKKALVIVGLFLALGASGRGLESWSALAPAPTSNSGPVASSRFGLEPVEVPGLGMGSPADRRWIAYYFRAPKPEEMPAVLERIAQGVETSGTEFLASNAQFFGTILREHPELKPKVEEMRKAAKEQAEGFLQQVIKASETPASTPAKTVEEVHALWAEFNATGDSRKLNGLLAIAELPETPENQEIKKAAARFIRKMTPFSARLYDAVLNAAKTGKEPALAWLNNLADILKEELWDPVNNAEHMASNLGGQHEFDAAMEKIRAAYRIFPDSTRLHRIRGWLASQAGQNEEARAAYQQAIAASPRHSETWYYLGLTQNNLRDYEGAVASFEKAMKLGYKNPEVWFAAAGAYQEKGDQQTALQYMQKYQSLKPHGPNEAAVKAYLQERGVNIVEDPEDLVAFLIRADYEGLEKKLSTLLQEKQKDDYGKSLIAKAYHQLCVDPSKEQGFDQFLSRFEMWVSSRPESHFAHACYGKALIRHAWNARGRGWASTVTEQGAKSFQERLKKAKEELEKAYSLNPSDPIPPASLITVAMGLGLDQQEVDKQFQRGISVSPEEYELYRAKMLCLAPKWCGSEAEMLGFARETAKNAPKGAITPKILADAHWELYKEANNDTRYFRQPGVWPELKEVYLRISSDPKTIYWINEFAMAAFYAGDYETASQQINRLGDQWESLYPQEMGFRKKVKSEVQRRLAQKTVPSGKN